ncbi:Arm DNA-binding domain-containing protein [Phenylobacterium sp.]|jgi:hypothetical protein|uniref:Arm DNA-binding domain-containing protein n=1 Tax=Phenylobacterium sp. TaxID=1871053 RepID=UPI0039C9390D
MAREINRLSSRKVATLNTPGMHADGAGLYLRVTAAGSKQWTLLFRWRGKRKEMGLGGINAVSLMRARQRAAEARAMVADGINPLVAKRAHMSVPTFGEVADEFIRLSPHQFVATNPWRATSASWARVPISRTGSPCGTGFS